MAVAAGLACLAIGFRTAPTDAWVWLLVGFVVFLGVTSGTLVWSAAFRVAQTRWTAAVNRLAHSAIAFQPALLVALIALLAGVRHYVPWVRHPVPAKAAWLNVPFMVWRDVVCLSVLWLLMWLMVRWSLRMDAQERVSRSDQYRLTAIGTAIVLTYTVTGSIVAYDFVMSLTPEWVSTMFAPYFWITNLYAGMALLILMSAILRGPLRITPWLEAQQFYDMGNLLLGFSLFSMGLFFAQYLTIWYENLPLETPFLILRYYKGAWPPLGWTAFIVGYAIPFILLQSRMLKRRPRWLSVVAALVLVGFALERYVLIVPSIEPHRLLTSPVAGVSLLAFAGAFVLAVAAFLSRYPAVSAADEALAETPFPLEIAE